MLVTAHEDDSVTVTEFDLEEDFSVELLSDDRRSYMGLQRASVDVEDGAVVIRVDNGTWWYSITGFSSLNSYVVHTVLARYER
jgi:hypothetical protein